MSSHKSTPDDLSQRIEALNYLSCEELLTLIEEIIDLLEAFPGFMGMDTIHAVELEPMPDTPDRGCLVVTPSGNIRELAIDIMPGPSSLGGYDYTEDIRDVELSSEELIWYRKQAIKLLWKFLKEWHRNRGDC